MNKKKINHNTNAGSLFLSYTRRLQLRFLRSFTPPTKLYLCQHKKIECNPSQSLLKHTVNILPFYMPLKDNFIIYSTSSCSKPV